MKCNHVNFQDELYVSYGQQICQTGGSDMNVSGMKLRLFDAQASTLRPRCGILKSAFNSS